MMDAHENLLQKFLQKIAAEHKHDNPDIETAAIPATGPNCTSQLFHATIKSTGKENLNVFAKVAVVDETMREQAGQQHIFDIETHFYTKLAKTYKEIEDKHDVPQEHRLVVPKFYGHSNNYLEEILVLQDLSKDGFVTHDRLKPIDWDYASKATEELAKFHALSMAYQKEYPEDFNEAKKVLIKRQMFPEDISVQNMLKEKFDQVILMIKEENKNKVRKFFSETFNPETFKEFYTPKKRPVIVHGDYRQSNVMHKIDKDGRTQVVIVDYQTLHLGSVALDFTYLMYTGSDRAFRSEYFDQLIDHYYEKLTAALRRLNLDPDEVFPRFDYDIELYLLMPLGLILASIMLPIVTADSAHVTKPGAEASESESGEPVADMISKTNALCAQRINDLVDDYESWCYFS